MHTRLQGVILGYKGSPLVLVRWWCCPHVMVRGSGLRVGHVGGLQLLFFLVTTPTCVCVCVSVCVVRTRVG